MIIKGKVCNLKTGEAVVGAKVEIYEQVSNTLTTVTTGNTGFYNSGNIDIFDKPLLINVSSENFMVQERSIQIPDKGGFADYVYDVNLQPCCISTVSNVNGRVTE